MTGEQKIGAIVYVSGDSETSFFKEDEITERISKLKSVQDFRYIKNDVENAISAVDDLCGKELSGLIVAYCCSDEESKKIHNHAASKDSVNLLLVDLYSEVFLPHRDQVEMANWKTIDMIRIAISASKKNVANRDETIHGIERSVAIIGGGISGISSALELAKNDVNVFLIEKESVLGGHLRDLYKIYPLMCPAQCSLEFHVPMLQGKDNVKVFLNSEVTGISGYGGNYKIELRTSAEDRDVINQIEVSSIIVATGWKSFNPSVIPNYGYGKYENIVTNLEFEDREVREKLLKKKDGHKEFSALFIQCVGSRDQRYLPYCSGICCNIAFKQIDYVKEKYPNAKIYVSYVDLRTPQNYELFYQSMAEKYPDIIMIRGKPGEISLDDSSGKLSANIEDTLRNERCNLNPDLVVLATGMIPNNKEIAAMAGIPLDKDGFPENHIQCNPYLSQGNGIYFAGSSMAPMDISSSIMSSLGASMKSYTYVNRSRNELRPAIETYKCDVCKRCIEECPQKALHLGSAQYPEISASGCEGCGVCMGACPNQAISLPSINPSLVNGWVSILSKTAQSKDQPLILAFLCKNDAYPLLQNMVANGFQYPANYRMIPVPCAGSVNMKWVSEALIKGIDGVLVVGCKESQCHYVTGSKLASVRVSNLGNTLENELKMGKNKLSFENISLNDQEKLADVLNGFVSLVKDEKRVL